MGLGKTGLLFPARGDCEVNRQATETAGSILA